MAETKKAVKDAVLSDTQMDEEAKRFGEIYAREPKVRIKIASNGKKGDEVIPVCINGYNYFINRGQTVEVPQTVADILEGAGYL